MIAVRTKDGHLLCVTEDAWEAQCRMASHDFPVGTVYEVVRDEDSGGFRLVPL